jgi:hypothetical protein
VVLSMIAPGPKKGKIGRTHQISLIRRNLAHPGAMGRTPLSTGGQGSVMAMKKWRASAVECVI